MNSWGIETYLILAVLIGLIPIGVGIGTCYLKFSIVLSILRSGFGTQNTPSVALVSALSVVMSLVVMEPVIIKTLAQFDQASFNDFQLKKISSMLPKLYQLSLPWREFLLKHSGDKELTTFSTLGGTEVKNASHLDPNDIPLNRVLAAFVVSEVKHAFLTGFFLLIPFYVIDLVVANLLVGMGLNLISPVIVSLPLKIMLFITTDAWLNLTTGLISAYQ